MLIDEVTIKVSAGKGGDGCVDFNKNLRSLGPVGARGGNGGSVYFEGVSDLSALSQFRYKKEIRGENGQNGRGQFMDGAKAEDITIKIPVGTVITNLSRSTKHEITKVGEKILIAKGGRGGRGNFFFKSPTNTTPMEFEYGKPGQSFNLKLEMKMIADVGLVGLPNVGKSSLLNELTKAKSKVADYRFTTLEPHLGDYYGLIIADIPGLIEGASGGRGLGDKFLRHVERTKVLFHLIAADSADPVLDYNVIRRELGLYNKNLLEKPEYIFLSKSDEVAANELKEKIKTLKKKKLEVTPLSIIDEASLKVVKKILNQLNQEKQKS
ncbi:MAG: GTPase ObgE [Patescibacteria group bacterium]|nr:GTPase ObgE [Patescibacteria group bacterium]